MTWLVEEPFWLILMLTLIAISAVILFASTRKFWLLIAAGFFLAAGIGAFLVDRTVVTDREQLMNDVYRLASAVANNDVEAAVSHFASSNQTTIERVRQEMPKYEFKTCNVTAIKNISFDDPSAPSTANVEVRVFVNLDANSSLFKDMMGPRAIVLTYVKTTAGDWKISDYRHFDPRQKDYLDARNPRGVMPGL